MDAVNKGHDAQQSTAVKWLRLFGAGLLFLFLLGTAFSAQAEDCVADFGGVIDGDTLTPGQIRNLTQINVDGNCTVRNFTSPNRELRANFSFFTQPGQNTDRWLVIFDNVVHTGQMSCNAVLEHKIWFTNGSSTSIQEGCQNQLIPVEKIDKQSPAATATIGVPFTYRLTIPVLYDPATGTVIQTDGSLNDLHSIVITDDLNATGVDLSVVGDPTVTWLGSGTPVPHTYTNNGGVLTFAINPIVPAGQQIVIDITVVLNDTSANVPGTQFINTATWSFGRAIDTNDNGVIEFPDEFYEPLPGENGISTPMTIAEPNLVVTKTGLSSFINLGQLGQFTIDVENTGLSDAWNVTITDLLPNRDPQPGGMCDYPLDVLSVTLAGNTLAEGSDFAWNYNNATPAPGENPCELTLTLLDPAPPISPGEHLIVTYESKLDADTPHGTSLTNVAGATQWYNDDSSNTNRIVYTETLSTGTPGTADHEDEHTVDVFLSGFFFEKTVSNPTPIPGETLTYTLRLQTTSSGPLTDITIVDVLDAGFDWNSFTVTDPGTTDNISYNPASGTITLHIPQLSASSETQVQFQVTLDSSLAEGDEIPNQASLTADAQSTVSDDPTVNGQADPLVPGDEDPTLVVISYPLPPSPLKATPQTTATIGEEVIYQITVPGTVSTRPLYDVAVIDPLDANLEYVSATVTGNVVGVSNNSTSSQIDIRISEIPAGQQAVIELHARVRNISSAQQGTVIENTASYTYANAPGGITHAPMTTGTVTLNIVEPYITAISKSASATTPTAGEVMRYSVTLTASGNSIDSDVFDVTLTDTLDLGLVYAGNPTVSGAGNIIGAPDISGDGINQAQTLAWSLSGTDLADIDIARGETITIEYDVRVLNNVLAGQTLSNSVVAEWTSLDGDTTFERDGSDGIGGLNDYITSPVTATVTTPGINATFSKNHISDTFGAGDTDVRIGDLVEYELRVSVPEGTLGNLQLVDTLPQGLEYAGTVSINGNTGPAPFVAVAPFAHADITAANVTGDPATGPSTVTWDLGNVTNQPNDSASDDFIIVYQARVLNNVFAHTELSIPLNNVVTMSYDTASGTVTQTDNDTIITALQPLLTVSKSSNPANGSAVVAGSTVTYTVDIQNSGTAPAYDVVLQDIIPDGMRVGGVTMVSTYLDSSGPTPGLANLAPVYNAATGVATWDFDAGIYTIPAGDTLHIVYSVQTDADLGEGLLLTNEVQVTTYYSFDDDAPPAPGDSADLREIYGPTNIASTTLYTGALPTKTLLSPTTPEATIGEEVIYLITVPGTASTSPLYDVAITDPLDANLEYLSASVTGNVVGVNNTSTATQMDITIDEIPAGEQAVIELHARVRNVQSAQQGTAINNTVSYTYANTPGGITQPAQSSGILTVNVVEPQITAISKNASPTTATVGEIVRYSVTLTASGGAGFSDVFDVTLTDTLDLGLEYAGNPTVSGASNIIGAPDITGDGINQAQTLVWSLSGANPADIDVIQGTSIIIEYDVRVLNNVIASQTLTNSVVAEWTSLDGGLPYVANTFERNGSDGIGGLNDYITAAATASVSTPPPGVLNKATTQASAAIGEEFTYLITVPATPVPTALQDVRIYDNLTVGGADLQFVSAEIVSPTTTPLQGSPDAGTGVVEISNTDGSGIDIPANGQVQVAITVVLLDTPANLTPGLSFTNRAWYTYSNGGVILGSDATTGATSDSMTVANPNLTMTKIGPDPATMRIGTPATFSLDVQNTGASDAWNVTVTDWLPNPNPGGMCDAGVNNISATIYESDGTTVVLPLVAGTHYATDFTVSGTEPRCEFIFTLTSPAYIAPGQRLIVTYSAALDADNIDATTLTNIAGATQWSSADPAGGVSHNYTAALSDGTVGTLDHQDAYSITVEGAILTSQKTVQNLTTGQSGATASPGDTLRYTISILNTTDIPLNDFLLVDEIERLNTTQLFQPGSISNVTVSSGAPYAIDGNTLTVSGLSIGANETITIAFDASLVPVIDNGTIVLNQGQLMLGGVVLGNTDDPAVSGVQDPTETLITSAPLMQVQKTSQDMTDDPNVLLAGDTLQYTITVQNIGTENAAGVILRDQIPTNTTYVPNTTTLNGAPIADPSAGVSPLQTGFLINAPPPEDTTPGTMRADASGTMDNVATITLQVVVNNDVLDGTVITNQGFVSGDGTGSDPFPQQPSDDPATITPNDPTRDVLGSLPLVDVLKTVALEEDNNDNGIVDPGDVLRYTITATNYGAVAASGVTLTDAIPANTTYVPNTVYLNDLPVGQPDGGVSPLVAGIPISSSDQTPPLPAVGYLSPGASAVVRFDVQVNAATPSGTIISNQGFVASNEQPLEPTDDDGLDSNGDQPTLIVVGDGQQLAITKEVLVVDGGPATAGGQLEYVVRVTNIGTVPATDVVIHDNLDDPVAGQMTFVDGSATLNGLPTGVTYTAPLLVADYGNTYGVLQPGQVVELRFRVLLDAGLAIGETVTNIAQAYWNAMTQTESANVSIDIGALQGVANLNGRVWHDVNFNDTFDSGEQPLENWLVEVYFRGNLLTTVSTDANGEYQVTGLASNYVSSTDRYELRFVAPDAGANTAKLGEATSDFSNGLQHIYDIVVYPGDNLQNLNLPIDPDGVIYDSVVRAPVAGATVSMLRATTNTALPASCFDDPAQQNQVTQADGFYKFDINFSQPECTSGSDYIISVTPPASGFVSGESAVIPPVTNAAIAPFSVPACLGSTDDAVPATASRCEVQTFATAPPLAIAARTNGTNYHLHLTLANGQIPGESQLFNNHIPLDPVLAQAVTISKTTPMVNVNRGTLVPYTIVVNNTLSAPLTDVAVIDNIPAGFKYVAGSARMSKTVAGTGQMDRVKTEPVVDGLQLSWDLASIEVDAKYTIELLLIVGAGVQEGEYVNRAHVVSNLTGSNISAETSATVRVVPDPTFDCSDIIGKVFDDRNHNGYQDEGEVGIPGVRIATARGLLVTTDKHGRFHVTCAMVPDEQRGSNFILKLDERSLPSGYRVTTENPRVQRLTRGKMVRFNFGATVHHVVSLSVADGVFQSDSTQIRPQWLPRLDLLIDELRKQPSILRMTYLADVESADLVDDRLAELKARILKRWKEVSSDELSIETEVFWRHGGPVENNSELSDSLNLLGFASGAFDQGNFGEDTEKQLPYGYTFTPWMQDPDLFKVDSPEIKTEQVTQKKYTTRKLTNVVPPIPFDTGEAEIPDEFVNKLRNVLDSMRDRVNVRLHFIGHTDNVQLSDELQRQYVDNLGLSRERAGTTAEFFQRALGLPPEAISYEGMGESKPIASNYTESGKARNRRVEVEVWYDEVSDELVDQTVEVDQEIKRIMVCRVETMCKLSYKQGHSRRTKLKNLVPPFHYDEGISEIPAQYLQQLRQALQNLTGKENVQMRFIGYTDNIPLGERDARIYGDHTGLSKANARRVATAVQEALGLRNIAVASTGKGSGYPLASNNSEKGRALNRRIEVEFWHDDPLEDLPDEPQICPESAAAETVERIYNPPEGDIQPIYFENGQPVIPEGYTKHLQRAMADLSDKGNLRLRFVGYTSNKRLDRRTAMVYGDDIGLSTARARRAMEAVKAQMNLSEKQAEFEGRGYVQSHDVVNTGFIELDQSKVEVQVVYDELAILDENEGVSIKRITRDVETQNPYALNLMRITVDGQPLNDPNKGIPDVQRCTDVALDKAQVHFKFDNLQVKPRLNVTAWPNVISYADSGDTEFVENLTNFKLYTNYPAFIDRAEVRLFDAEQSTRDTPIAVVPLNETGEAQWQVNLDEYSAPRMELKYVLRVYDKQGNFDETTEQTLWIVDELEADNSKRDAQKEILVGYGENRLGVNNIPLNGGVVKVYGKDVPKDHQVWFAGHPLPVAESGEFGSEFILPSGLHTVEVAITDEAGDGNVYQRDLELEKSDWFYVGIADLTVARDSTNGPAEQVTGDDQHYNNDFAVDGRLAFYAKGKLENESVLTMSADTREGPVDELFTNFMDKSPDALFRRIDPDYYYPTFGDDSTVEEDAPTSGKFYLKWHKDKNYALWGNFDIAYLDNNLAHVDRGLYGSNFNYETESATTFGEKRFAANLFAAEPGTLAGRDEFLGTSGSLYYLRHQDILTGSDRLRIEIRDAVSGMVVSVKNLTYGLDYDIDYIQGRIMLNEPLSATAASGMLVNSADFGGNDVYLVARYEYTPGFSDLNDIVTGGRMHYWLNDYVKLGTTIEDQEVTGSETSLNAFDVTLRKNAGTWLKLEQSTSQGPVSSSLLSSDGGYNFTESALAPGTDIKANGQRVDASVRLEDIFASLNGKITLYNQQLDAGYAAPGLITQTDTSQTGAMLEMPVTDNVNVKLKADSKDQENALQTEALEANVDYLWNKNWTFGLGLRNDKRTDNSPIVPLTQQEGDRSDVAVRATYDSKEDWQAYGYVQDSTSVSGNRDENGRVGVGGDYRPSDRFKVDGELSSGDLGTAVKLGTDYKMTDATDLYTSYALENERTDNGVKARKGNLATGFKNRYSDSASIYMEERYTHGDVPTGLTHALGFDLAATDRLNIGGSIDVGTLVDNNTGAKTDRTGLGFRIGYKFDALTYAGALEYRTDETEQPDTSFAERNTWLIKNSLKYLLNPDWRLIGKLNHSESESSLGEFYNGDFTEAVLGYAYRPVDNDALNALFKYTYFYNMPTTDQLTLNNSAAQYIQKSHILSLDVMYDLTPSWTLGGKYAHRFGQLSLDRENPEFFDSTASLYILRADWHFTHRWDALLEGRLLDVKEAGDTRSGMLLGIYRHFDDNMKLGVGYNFTDFSDDLTDMDYDSQGLFINVIGKF